MTIEFKTTELVEAAGMSILRQHIEAHMKSVTGISFKTPMMFKLANLSKSTTSHKVVKGVVADLVSKPYEVFNTTKDGKPFIVITANQRLMLSETRKQLKHTDAVMRLTGAFVDALTDLFIPREANAKGNLHRTKYGNRALKLAGWVKWNEPLDHGKRFVAAFASKVTFGPDAYEIPKKDKVSNGRKVYKIEISTISGKKLGSTGISKLIGSTYRGKENELLFKLVEVDEDEWIKANKAAKDAKKAADIDADEADEEAMLAEIDERIEAAKALEPVI